MKTLQSGHLDPARLDQQVGWDDEIAPEMSAGAAARTGVGLRSWDDADWEAYLQNPKIHRLRDCVLVFSLHRICPELPIGQLRQAVAV